MGISKSGSSGLTFAPMEPSINFGGKTLVLPTGSPTAAFAADWIIESAGLSCVGIFSSELVTPLVQPNAFSSKAPTTAMELYSSPSSTFAVIQIRSIVFANRTLADQISAFATSEGFAQLLALTGASGHFLSGPSLTDEARIRKVGEVKNFEIPEISITEIHQGGMLKHLSKVPALVALSSGAGFSETELLSRQLAAAALKVLGFADIPLKVPKSILHASQY